MATFNPEFNGIWDCLLLKRASFESVYSIRGRRVKSHIACLIETLEELQEEEAEQSPETWPKPPTEPETEISHGHTVTSEQSLLFTVTAADNPISPPALRLHTTVVHWRDAISLLEMTLVELRDKRSASWPRVPPDVMVPAYFTAGVGLFDGRHRTVFAFSLHFSCFQFGYTHMC